MDMSLLAVFPAQESGPDMSRVAELLLKTSQFATVVLTRRQSPSGRELAPDMGQDAPSFGAGIGSGYGD
jgi:hypothetical protein